MADLGESAVLSIKQEGHPIPTELRPCVAKFISHVGIGAWPQRARWGDCGNVRNEDIRRMNLFQEWFRPRLDRPRPEGRRVAAARQRGRFSIKKNIDIKSLGRARDAIVRCLAYVLTFSDENALLLDRIVQDVFFYPRLAPFQPGLLGIGPGKLDCTARLFDQRRLILAKGNESLGQFIDGRPF